MRNFGSDVNVHQYIRPSIQNLGEGDGSPKATQWGRRMPSFLGAKSHDAFGQPAFFLAGNPHLMTSMRVFSVKKSVELPFRLG